MAEFVWDEHNRQHVEGHGVDPAEAEDALRDPRVLAVEAYNHNGERRWAALGETENDRLLFVVFTRRRDSIRVITARTPEPGETRRYRRSRR